MDNFDSMVGHEVLTDSSSPSVETAVISPCAYDETGSLRDLFDVGVILGTYYLVERLVVKACGSR